MEKIYIKTFGCQMNEYDSLRIMKLLEPYGYSIAGSYNDASVILLNTCSVRKKAEDKVYSELGRIKIIKNSNPATVVGIGGCLAQQEGRNLIARFPFIDLVFGTKTLFRLPKHLEMVKKGKKVVDIEMDSSEDIYPKKLYSSEPSQVSAFVTIMQGCNNFCSYCIVPYVRGREWSRTPEDISSEVKNLVMCGVKEITLLGQNVNSYGKSLSPEVTFSVLLTRLNQIDGLERIRFTTSHPKDLSDELIMSMANLEKVCKHIHMPLQSGSNSILKAMNRDYTREDYIEKIDALRRTVPDIGITSDIIVGFPGETEKDFNDTVSIIQNICFDDLFLFHYTDRPGTRASDFDNNIPYNIKIKRLTIIKENQKEISINNNRKMVGRTLPVLFENLSKRGAGHIAGRISSNKVINCEGGEKLIGTTKEVMIEKANIHSLAGKIIHT